MPSRKTKKANLPLAMASGNTVDIFRSKRIANIFFFFVSAAKASLLPFLTIYFRLLGLTPIQTGIVFGTQAMTMAIMVPFWLKISYLCNKKKLLMLCSIFILIVSHLALTAVPPKGSDQPMIWCPSDNYNHSLTGPSNTSALGMANTTSSPMTTSSDMFGTTTPTPSGEVTETTPPAEQTETTPASTEPQTMAGTVATTTSEPDNGADTPSEHHESSANIQPASKAEHRTTSSKTTASHTTPSRGSGGKSTRHVRQQRSSHRSTRHIRSLSDQIAHIQSQVYSINHRTFALVLFIIIFGEVLSCAAEKFADDAWFTLLDSVDDVEKYGSHKYWSAVAYIFYAVIVALVVDTRECFLSLRIHHFMIHFYVFAGLLVLAFLTGLFYPFYPRDKPSKHHAQRSKVRILCSDFRSFLYVFTIVLLGCVNAGITCFLFWLIQDVGGSEIQMGVIVMVRAITELFMLIFGKQLIRRLGIPFCAVVGLLAMVGRLVYLSFLWTPWAAVPVEILYGLSNTLLWQAVCAHPDFSLNIITRRFTQNIFYILYYGVGASVGCVIAGYGYAYKSLPVVYQASAVVVGVWSVLFAIAQKCLPKPPQVKYARLLADDEDESESDEDDWLEMALKNH